MAFHIKNPDTDALARRIAALKKIGLTEAVHTALTHELEREQGKPTLVDLGVQFCRDLRARGNPQKSRPADKVFRDGLYEVD
ncbi:MULTISPECIES: type II toxin-antitoxin system VapB family antitoxin [Bradyrhizobium]|uniref:Transcription factor n=3 Tax=Bradyrhizobium TaxID=374 RepID=A0A410VJ47_9BRAD|nr:MULTISPECIES: type II toxin-antitoxin system VapB family antitoxin [Bradyrhizobium]MCG2629372.1 type II toxin-antitoxin system VapB family antitoxin [Bradyrhizobium zhengyangense]MCG2644653.1 type II toxin-antitoxin system VapB family antitoxin [Bradyrhizobium zhengyangense]MCG2670886.1 type II toxin-antitoxin system VapB family antitoxin [Bradyrhizobium zhengyangense]MDN4984519.1 type II toxin-antitoxin system VapB family antitoxin [Bradyrhizobium sp. WYCCWR 13022]MDN5002511.1 type II toxi